MVARVYMSARSIGVGSPSARSPTPFIEVTRIRTKRVVACRLWLEAMGRRSPFGVCWPNNGMSAWNVPRKRVRLRSSKYELTALRAPIRSPPSPLRDPQMVNENDGSHGSP